MDDCFGAYIWSTLIDVELTKCPNGRYAIVPWTNEAFVIPEIVEDNRFDLGEPPKVLEPEHY